VSHPSENSENSERPDKIQYSTFFIAGHLYGIDVTQVQEIVKSMPTTQVPLAKNYVKGLINLRGQVATAIELRKLLEITEEAPSELMNVVCRCDGNLISFMVDEIGEVIEVSNEDFEQPPNTIPENIRSLMTGVYKTEQHLISIINVENVMQKLSS